MKTILIVLLLSSFIIQSYSQSKTGCISGNCANGFGVFIFENGDKYEGIFENNKLSGFGIYTEINGNIYKGYFSDNKFNGIGEYTAVNGNRYIGEFKNGQRHGLGTFYFSKSFYDKGKWENNNFIGAADFDDFIIENPNDFCLQISKILNSAANNFEDIKDEPISKMLKDSYHSKIKLIGFNSHEINIKEGYKAQYYKGEANEATKQFEKLRTQILSCSSESGILLTEKFYNGIEKKFYEYSNNLNKSVIKISSENIGSIVSIYIIIYKKN